MDDRPGRPDKLPDLPRGLKAELEHEARKARRDGQMLMLIPNTRAGTWRVVRAPIASWEEIPDAE